MFFCLSNICYYSLMMENGVKQMANGPSTVIDLFDVIFHDFFQVLFRL